MTKENPPQPLSDTELGPPSRPPVVSWFLRPKTPPLWLGIVVGASLIAIETLLVSLLQRFAPNNAFGALFLLGVLVISAGWGFRLAVAATVASAAVYMFFHLGHEGFLPTQKEDWTAIVIFVPIALLANLLVGQARVRAAEADQRRREAVTSREKLRALAEQQAALRRVATLVAEARSPSEVFSAVADELARRLGLPHAALVRFEPDGSSVLIAYFDDPPTTKRLGERYPLGHGGVAEEVYLTGRAARMDHQDVTGLAAVRASEMGLASVVGVPIVVHGRIWGAALVGSSETEPLPVDCEFRVEDFTDLVATAISNAQARSELAASRARIVTAADGARRRLERDLHDGAQQRLVSLGLEMRAAESTLRSESSPVADQISEIVAGLTSVSEELREISRGIHPAILSKGGLGPALKAVARRSAVPVDLDIAVDRRLPESVEVAAYFVVAESLTNVARHAHASEVHVTAESDDAYLRLAIHDDGAGGADPAKGSGLIGLIDRVEALGGRIELASPAGDGTSLDVTIPLESPDHG
jgi:signal transduction histidine kinase